MVSDAFSAFCPRRSTGSGVLIEGREGGGGIVLTAAHVVANSTYVQVRACRAGPRRGRGAVHVFPSGLGPLFTPNTKPLVVRI